MGWNESAHQARIDRDGQHWGQQQIAWAFSRIQVFDNALAVHSTLSAESVRQCSVCVHIAKVRTVDGRPDFEFVQLPFHRTDGNASRRTEAQSERSHRNVVDRSGHWHLRFS